MYVCDEFYKRGKKVERAIEGGKKEAGRREMGAAVWNMGFGFPSLRGERKAIDSEAESEADRVAARGCTGTQWEHDLDTNKVTA